MTPQAQMLTPAIVLVIWSLVMLMWMARERFAAFDKQGIELGKSPPGGRGESLNGVLPDQVMWKSHNYTHLMEQPTIFYPTVVALAILGPGVIDVVLAWSYVLFRIVHSLWQALVNRLPVRVRLFQVSTYCLVALALRALWAALNSGVPA